MIYFDVKEGVSGDMLLSALIGLHDDEIQKNLARKLKAAASRHNLNFRLSDVEDAGDCGHAVTWIGSDSNPHGRNWEEAFGLLEGIKRDLGLLSQVPDSILRLIFEAEAEVHGENVETVHLHEIGRTGAIVNIAGIGLAFDLLGREHTEDSHNEFSIITIGKGTVAISHGAIRVPAPASKILLRGLKSSEGAFQGERATPTGIAALRVLCQGQATDLTGRYHNLNRYHRRSVGFGSKSFGGRLGRVVAYLL